ncbi:hypothetical protein SAY86_021719 [Trapa natans]|uniref:Uncharacterized protein n=1 Tax=Trapa natans TaxID=22666 RepID=A0AAN7MKW7_TRANT|nr:hypothetical protein SAY86_021719 [Trapa natans]
MEAQPLTKESLALTEKKMDMALDDIIKMSKGKEAKGKRARVPNKSRRAFNNAAQDKSMSLRRFMNSRSSLRQGVLAQKRSYFQANQFPLANEAARKAAVTPLLIRAPRSRILNSNKARARAPFSRNMSSNNKGATSKRQQDEWNGAPKQRPQTLDARFPNLKEQRIKETTFSHPDNSTGQHNGGIGKQIPPWTRFPK